MRLSSQFFILASIVALVDAAALSTVKLDYGTFTGLTNTTTGIIYFRGVQYADAPVGVLRWQAPVSPPTTQLGEVDASNYAAGCIANTQTATTSTTSEDCLFLNVFLPIATTAYSALPVLVYFHGGGFEGQSTHIYPPENIIQGSAQPLIFVTVEYRLGQFGFLGQLLLSLFISHKILRANGIGGSAVKTNGTLNAGLLDQKAALVWIQRYITKFGGDPTRVTIWGQSAGGGSTMLHLIGDNAGNGKLFHQAMGDSPSLGPLPHYTDAFVEDLFTQFAGFAGCGSSGSNAAIMTCLRAAPTNTLALAGSQTNANLTSTIYPFGPIQDGAYISTRPVEAFLNGDFVRVPVLYGSNTDDGANWSANLPNPAANTSSENATETTVYKFIQGQFHTFTEASFHTAITELYPFADYKNVSLQGQQMYGELRYICTAVMITGAAHNFGLPAYQYRWDNPKLDSNHSSELAAFFNGAETFDTANEELVVAMRSYFTSFATSGVPTANNSIVWPVSTVADNQTQQV
ncbi:Carboxylic ester hydrolase [Mycena venus]|uniref:Carboxylic ester hydrolase n=1 Tax=Mycena venus TaxID=2733690 RepID=A0A8H6Y0J3_9AGAR|nr:Carboxylic ester hydrolase [Mycena venus]